MRCLLYVLWLLDSPDNEPYTFCYSHQDSSYTNAAQITIAQEVQEAVNELEDVGRDCSHLLDNGTPVSVWLAEEA